MQSIKAKFFAWVNNLHSILNELNTLRTISVISIDMLNGVHNFNIWLSSLFNDLFNL